MADFRTHLIGAAAVSGIAATGLMLANVVPEQKVITYFVLGAIGGMLPDIDSETSIPFRVAFNVLAVFSGFLAVLSLGQRFSLVELIIVWTLCFVAVRYGICTAFCYLTVHRGLIHSIPAGIIFGLLTVLGCYHILEGSAMHAWMCWSFVALGFLIHLLLDEIYSVDLMGGNLKSSFGSAFNLGSLAHPLATAALYLAIFGLLILGPRPNYFFDGLLNGDYHNLLHRALPTKGWFEGWQVGANPADRHREACVSSSGLVWDIENC